MVDVGKTVARAKCCYCGAGVFIAEGTNGSVIAANRRGQMVCHTEPFCEKYLAADPDKFINQCDFKPVDPIAEALRDMLK